MLGGSRQNAPAGQFVGEGGEVLFLALRWADSPHVADVRAARRLLFLRHAIPAIIEASVGAGMATLLVAFWVSGILRLVSIRISPTAWMPPFQIL